MLLFNNFRLQNSACVLSGWVMALPPIDGALCSVDGVMGTSYGPSLLGRQDSKLFGTGLPIIPWMMSRDQSPPTNHPPCTSVSQSAAVEEFGGVTELRTQEFSLETTAEGWRLETDWRHGFCSSIIIDNNWFRAAVQLLIRSQPENYCTDWRCFAQFIAPARVFCRHSPQVCRLRVSSRGHFINKIRDETFRIWSQKPFEPQTSSHLHRIFMNEGLGRGRWL